MVEYNHLCNIINTSPNGNGYKVEYQERLDEVWDDYGRSDCNPALPKLKGHTRGQGYGIIAPQYICFSVKYADTKTAIYMQ